MIPLYMYPGPAWDRVTAEKVLHPSVPIYAIINPSNGVGSSLDPHYTGYIAKFHAAGVVVLGYIVTGYGRRSAVDCGSEAMTYLAWYQTDGYFFDEYQSGWVPPSVPGVLIGNPGTDATGPIPLITYEQAGMPPSTFRGNYIAHSVPRLPSVIPPADYLYISDDRATYMVLPTYFSDLVTRLDTGTLPPSPPPPPLSPQISLTIDGKTYRWTVQS